MSVQVRSVVKFLAECTEPECVWEQLHDEFDAACADAKRHRREWHPRPSEDSFLHISPLDDPWHHGPQKWERREVPDGRGVRAEWWPA